MGGEAERSDRGRTPTAEALVGCLLGTAVGDAIGLPYEGLSSRRAQKLFPDVSRHHLLFGRGMVSDDTDHACFVAQAWIRSGGDVEVFRRSLARSLRWWLAALPAGVGLATARAILKLWIGFPPGRSGVFSAGNGPSMRAPLLGVALGNDARRLQTFVRASTELTHTDPKAYVAALAAALAAHVNAERGPIEAAAYRSHLTGLLEDDDPDGEFVALVDAAARSAGRGESVAAFADSIGSRRGVSGYSYHTVPCVLQAWLRHPDDFARGLEDIIRAGGDTDTAGAIFGGIAGARAGKAGIPEPWIAGIAEWPRSTRWIEDLARAAARAGEDPSAHRHPPGYLWPAVPARNLFFLTIVLAHGLRRLAPPY